MRRLILVVLFLFMSACTPSDPNPNPPIIDETLNLEGMVFVKVDYQSSPDQWQSRSLMESESNNILRSLTLEPLEVSDVNVELSLWIVLYTQENMYYVARTNEKLYVKDDGGDVWYQSNNTSFESIFDWIYPDYRFMIDRFENLMVKGAITDQYKSLLLSDDNSNVVSTLLNDSLWSPHLERFNETLWYDAIITMNNGDTIFLLEDERGTLMWVVSTAELAHGYVLEEYVLSRLISEMTPSFLLQYLQDPLIEAELMPEAYEEDGLLISLDEIISEELLANTRMDEWSIAIDIPAVGLMVDLVLFDEVYAYAFAPWQEFDIVMIHNTLFQTNDFYFTPQGLGLDLRARIENYYNLEPSNP